MIACVVLATAPAPAAGPSLTAGPQPREPAEIFLAAHAAYDAGEHDRAASLYEEVLQSGIRNGLLYYNLGNALLRAGHLGRAIASYRKAESLLPRASDVRANLEYARKVTKDAIAPHEASPVLRTLFFWHYGLSERELLLLLVIVNLLFWSTLAIQQARRQSEILRWSVVVLFAGVLAVGASSAIRALSPQRIAVVNNYEVDVRSGISSDTVVRFKLHEGTEARLVDVQQDWARIGLPDGKQGWVQLDDVLLVTL